jgi:hypothetical protein
MALRRRLRISVARLMLWSIELEQLKKNSRRLKRYEKSFSWAKPVLTLSGYHNTKDCVRYANREDGEGACENASRTYRIRATHGTARDEYKHRVSQKRNIVVDMSTYRNTDGTQVRAANATCQCIERGAAYRGGADVE